jgi:hypothetical protein
MVDYRIIYDVGDKVEFIETFNNNEPREMPWWVPEIPKGTIGEIINTEKDSILVGIEGSLLNGLVPEGQLKEIRFYGSSNEIYKENPIDILRKIQ